MTNKKESNIHLKLERWLDGEKYFLKIKELQVFVIDPTVTEQTIWVKSKKNKVNNIWEIKIKVMSLLQASRS